MSERKRVVECYFDGFRKGDHQQILALLTDDVAWDLPGYRHLAGKEAFDQEIENDEFVGHPALIVDRVVEEDATVVAIGEGQATHRSGAAFRFAFRVHLAIGSARTTLPSGWAPPRSHWAAWARW